MIYEVPAVIYYYLLKKYENIEFHHENLILIKGKSNRFFRYIPT